MPYRCTALVGVLVLGLLPIYGQAQTTLDAVTVIASTPVGGTGIDADKFAGNVQRVDADVLYSGGNADWGQKLNQTLGSVHVNDTQGNAYASDVNYRGFTASPVLGTPQGLSVYLDGMRINEPFGDVVSWDLLPLFAIDKVTVIPGSNPVYGLNTLGGAIALDSKSGSAVTGSQLRLEGGAFGRLSMDTEHGQHGAEDSLYFAASAVNDPGWAAFNPSQVRQFFGKYSRFGNTWQLSAFVLLADNLLYGNQAVPVSMLDNAAHGYSHPDYSATRNATLNLQGNLDLDLSNSLSGTIYLRNIARDVLNSNINDVVSSAVSDASCVSTSHCAGANLLAHYVQDIAGVNLQWSNTDAWHGLNQVFTMGLNAETSDTQFNNDGQNAYVDSQSAVVGADAFYSQARVRSHNQRAGLFASSTLDATNALSITLSGRYDFAALDLDGISCVNGTGLCDASSTVANGQLTNVSGSHSYQRFNPALGFTVLLAPHLIGFANYAEGFRTPSAIELACADPATPCSGIPNAFGADPDLKAVVATTYELGLRGTLGSQLKWRTAYYISYLQDDILFNQSSLNSGYFSNVGRTQRQGLELGLDGRTGATDYSLDLDWIDASYQSSFQVANSSNSAAAVAVQAGDHIPGIPAWVLKLHVGYAVDAVNRVGLSLQAQGASFARGDENNLDVNGAVPGFAVIKLDWNHSLGNKAAVYAGVNNLLDARYASYGTLASNNLASGGAEQFRALGAPRTWFAGLQWRF